MGDVTLHGVLNMPTDLWRDTDLDKNQRHSRYVQASERIKELEKSVLGLKHNLSVIEDELSQVDETQCSISTWDRVFLALEFAEE